MGMYFFHIRHADGVVASDDVGVELDSVEHARHEADQALAGMVSDLRPGDGVTLVEVTVQDEEGRTIARRSARFEAEDISPG